MPLPAVQDRGGRPMSTATSIEWTEVTWNPTTGCDRISPGCDHCYALTLAKRLKAMGQAKYQTDGDPRTSGPGFGVALHEEVLTEPLRWRKPRVCFVDSMADLAHGKVAHHLLAMSHDPDGRPDPAFLKRASNPWEAWPLPNVWVGTSIELDRYAWRADLLRQAMARIRFLSLEPLLGPLPSLDLAGIDWVIVGGESGPGHRPLDLDWVRDLRDRCVELGIAFFFKLLCTRVLGECESAGSLDEHSADLLDSATQLLRRAAQLREPRDEPVQVGARHDVLFVQGPHPPGGQPAVRGLNHRPSKPTRAAQRITSHRILPLGVVEGQPRGLRPEPRCPLPQCCGKPRPWQLADQHPGDRQLADDHVGGDAGQVERQPLDPEPALLGLGQVVLDLVEVPVVQVDPAALDGQPGAAVHPTAPLPGREHRSRPAERADVVRVEPAA